MSDDRIIVTQEETPYDFGHGVVLSMSEERARVLFHDLNRLLSLIDDEVGPTETLDPGDQRAYDRVNTLLTQLQSDLGIDPEDHGSRG